MSAPSVRYCACPCRQPFTTSNPAKRYLHASHRPPRQAHYTNAEHKQRRALLAHPPNGEPCPRCGFPMTREQFLTGKLHTGHVVDRVLGGAGLGFRFEHNSCGFGAGATLGNHLRKAQAKVRATVTSREW